MKCFPFLTANALAAILFLVTAATTSRAQTSPVVGFLQRPVAAAADPAVPAATVLSFPLTDAPVFTGSASAVNGADTLTVASANWSDGQWTGTPHLLRVVSGANTGRAFVITAHTNVALTLATRGLDLSTVLQTGDTVEILPAHTLGNLFGTSTPTLQTGPDAATADAVQIWNGVKFKTYFHNGTSWTKGAAGANHNDVVILPDAGVSVLRRGTSALTLTFNGRPPDTTERSEVPGPLTTFLANRFPVDTSLGALGLQGLPGWQSAASADAADTVLLLKNDAWVPYYFDGSAWHKAGKAAVADAKNIPAGSAVLVVRQSTATGAAATLTQDPPYPAN